MNRFRLSQIIFSGLVVAIGCVRCVGVASASEADAASRFYEEKVKPILLANCVKCHGGEKTKGGLALTTREALLAGGETGPVVNLQSAEKSLLLDAIGYQNDKLQMPPSGKLSPNEIDILAKWVGMGLPWSKGDGAPVGATTQPASHGPPKVDDKARAFWSFRPLVRPPVPAVKETSWVANPIDAFVLSKLESRDFAPAAPADKTALIRRATYDLTGLPPTPAEVEGFVNDPSPEAYPKLVDRLLASPRYGEKWGRHWLDLVRFAETNSYERDSKKPNAWRYRDYVIRAFNNDKPYDRFLQEQLAGDEMPEAESDSDPVIATGFYRLGIWDDEPADFLQHRYDVLDDIVATVGQSFLGVTIDCARCHDHKIDPIPQRDYYKLLSFFQNLTDYRNGGPTDEAPIFENPADRETFRTLQKERSAQLRSAKSELSDAEKNFVQLLQGEPGRPEINPANIDELFRKEGDRALGKERAEQFRALKQRVADLQKPPDGPTALCVTETGPVSLETFVMTRGSAHAPGAKVEPGFLEVVSPADAVVPAPPAGAKTSGRRTVLAKWITAKSNPLTARVMANRIWQYHFGRGIVRSSSNFGYGGEAPTHPELLDWLASEFQAGDWGMKRMHRLIMNSSAYRMSSAVDEKAIAIDPRNDLLWRFDMRRLTSEEIRDSILSVNGSLNLTMFGPGVYPPIPRQVMLGQSRPGDGWDKSTPEEAARRSIYVHAKRSLRLPVIESFDGAETDKSCPVRFVTVQPTQALSFLNGDFLNAEAQKLASRVRKEAGGDVSKQIAGAFRLVTLREPAASELGRGVELYHALIAKDGASPDVAMRYVCLVMLNLNEFVYLD